MIILGIAVAIIWIMMLFALNSEDTQNRHPLFYYWLCFKHQFLLLLPISFINLQLLLLVSPESIKGHIVTDMLLYILTFMGTLGGGICITVGAMFEPVFDIWFFLFAVAYIPLQMWLFERWIGNRYYRMLKYDFFEINPPLRYFFLHKKVFWYWFAFVVNALWTIPAYLWWMMNESICYNYCPIAFLKDGEFRFIRTCFLPNAMSLFHSYTPKALHNKAQGWRSLPWVRIPLLHYPERVAEVHFLLPCFQPITHASETLSGY
jgi:hypothetical protein